MLLFILFNYVLMFVFRLMNKKFDMLNVIDMLYFCFDRWKL